MRTNGVIIVALGGASLALSAQSPTPVVAVLEYPQCAGDSVLAVRPLFTKLLNGWVALTSAEAAKAVDLRAVEWTAALAGRALGMVRTTDAGVRTDRNWVYARDRRLTVASNPIPPKVANVHHDFEGWCSAPPTRPLVLVKPAKYRDPDGWTLDLRRDSVQVSLFGAFRKAAGRIVRCPNGVKAIPFPCTAENVVVKARYRDRAGRRLVALQLDEELYGCDGPHDDGWSVHWFLLDTGIRPLGLNLELVDAGDFDGDGVSELLFWHSGYNYDGYTLYYDGFRRRADFSWGYH